MSDFNTYMTDNPVCPHCGAEFEDASEWMFDFYEEHTAECSCGKSFKCQREIAVVYSTFSISTPEVKP